MKNKAPKFNLIPTENRLVGTSGWDEGRPREEVRRGKECCFIGERQQENHISVSVSICQGTERRGGWRRGEARRGWGGVGGAEEDKVSRGVRKRSSS